MNGGMGDRRDRRFRRDDGMHKPQDLGEHLSSMASRLKLNFRSTLCREQSFPPFNKQSCEERSLPSELRELILAHLPTLTLLEVKAVCRSWRDLLQSSSFKETWRRKRRGSRSDWVHVWVMKSKEEEDLIAYVPAVDKYYLFLSLLCSPLMMKQPAFDFDLKGVHVLCACWPWIVFGKDDWRSAPFFFIYDLALCKGFQIPELRLQDGNRNDINNILPSSFPELIIHFRPPFRGLAVDVQSVNDDGSRPLNQLVVHNLRTRSWERYQQSSAIQADPSDMSPILNGLFFRYDQEENTLYAWSAQHWSKAVIAFSWCPHQDMQSRELSSVQTSEIHVFKVIRNRGDIFLLTSTVQQQERGEIAQCCIVWKLMKGAEESAAWNWFEISRTPAELCLKGFNRESFAHPTAMCDGRRICILSSTNEFSPALVYDVVQGSWYHLHGVFRDMQAHFAMVLNFSIDALEAK